MLSNIYEDRTNGEREDKIRQIKTFIFSYFIYWLKCEYVLRKEETEAIRIVKEI